MLRLCKFEIMTLAPMATETAAHAFVHSTDRSIALLIDGEEFRGDSGILAPAANKGSSVLIDLCRGDARPSRVQAIEAIIDTLPDNTAVFSTIGKCARELFESGDQPNDFYQVGSMGCDARTVEASRITPAIDGFRL